MLRLRRLEVEGFGPFAEPQILDFPDSAGVTVVYGENMRGKTSLLNAIRYAFFGTVLGRGSRVRRLHTISNRDLGAHGKFGFKVSLVFNYDGDDYELVRLCEPKIDVPSKDEDYEQHVLLRRGSSMLGPNERKRALQQIFPEEVSRFFLFDGELLQEYEELLRNESQAGHRISEAIERILGLPILKRGRSHLTQLAEDADRREAKEASKHQNTQALGNTLSQLMEIREQHQKEASRLESDLGELTERRREIEQQLQSQQKYASILHERDEATQRLAQAAKDEAQCLSEMQKAMTDGWRCLLREPVRAARAAAQSDARRDLDSFVLSLRARAVETGHCETCEQDIAEPVRVKLREGLPAGLNPDQPLGAVSKAMSRWADLSRFDEADNVGEVRQLWKRLQALKIEQVTLKHQIKDQNAALADADPDVLRRSKASYAEIADKVAAVKGKLAEQIEKVDQEGQNIQRFKKQLAASGSADLRTSQLRSETLGDAAAVFDAAVDQYKANLRSRVEQTASELFLAMTTERHDYAGLTINESYGLSIVHTDGKEEEARSAGAEHVVALALMGALQKNAPLRGPIVMDSPFGRLDETHTSNVVTALPQMAEQAVLLVYESEVGRDRMRKLLGKHLLNEYELEYVSARRTNVKEVK